ncbi:uncharacterized protein LOC128875491 [Hylaeus volcanicus]|uniref:uncharacterized protein LOC128875491 n=1 Tax=Hylaeus volcanicus TaxID=313075 RepID=UPI0023B857B3|nr:uncharacterized protein LOC128875491 [Hylaeus volcanicus]
MSTQRCGRDQQKMKQVIDQINMLANNLDDLRAEIGALKINYLANDLELSSNNRHEHRTNDKSSVLYKVKKYTRKIGNVGLLKTRHGSAKEHEVYYPNKTLDPALLSPLRYIFRIGKKGNVFHIPTEITCLTDECSQTDNKSRQQFARPSVDRNLTTSKYVESVEEAISPHKAKQGIQRHDKIIFGTKRATLFPRFSELSCELDSYPEDPTFLNSYTFPSKSNLKDTSQARNVCLPNENEQFVSTYTQTIPPKVKRKRRNFNFPTKHSNLNFAKIRNAVITKKMIRNPNEKTFTVCRDVSDTKDYPYVKQKLYECSCKTKRVSNTVETVHNKTFEREFSIEKDLKRFNNVSSMSEDNMYEQFSYDEELESSPSISLSMGLEQNVSNSSNEIEESYPCRKPRTYTINKRSQKHNNSWFDRFESIIYVGETSDLTLSSQSFQN